LLKGGVVVTWSALAEGVHITLVLFLFIYTWQQMWKEHFVCLIIYYENTL